MTTWSSLVDEFLPEYDVSDAVAVVVAADSGTTWEALLNTDLIDVGRKRPMVAVLGSLRVLPDIVHRLVGGEVPAQPEHMHLRDLSTMSRGEGGWVFLGCRERDEIAFGLVGKFWRPVIQFAPLPSAAAFQTFDQPGFARTVYSLSVRPLAGNRTLLTGTMRTATTDAHARRWFRRYWTLGVGSGAHVLVNGLLEVTRDAAEREIP